MACIDSLKEAGSIYLSFIPCLPDISLNAPLEGIGNSFGQIVFHLKYYEAKYFSLMIERFSQHCTNSIGSFIYEKRSCVAYTPFEISTQLSVLADLRESNIKKIMMLKNECWIDKIHHDVHGLINFDFVLETVREHDVHHIAQLNKYSGGNDAVFN